MQTIISDVISIESDPDYRNKRVNEYLNRGYKLVQIVQTGPSLETSKHFPCYLVTYVLEK